MRGLQQYRPLQLLYRRFFLLILAVAVIFIGRGVWDVYQKERETRENRAQTEAQYRELAERNAELEEELAELGSERGVEAQLRQQYEVAREGEHLLIIVETPAPPVDSEPEPAWKGWFSWWPF